MKTILKFPFNKFISIRMTAKVFKNIECGQEIVITGMVVGEDYPPVANKSRNATVTIQLKELMVGEKPKTFHGSEDLETGKLKLATNKREETMKSNIGIAKVCHEANRQYCIDNKLPTQALWNELPVTQQNSIINGVQQVIADPKVTATKMHENWMEYKASEGWKYADELDIAKKLHPNMVPFNKLPKVERAKDMLFIKTVKTELKK